MLVFCQLYFVYCSQCMYSIHLVLCFSVFSYFSIYQSVHLVVYIKIITFFPMKLIPLICSMHLVLLISLYIVICILNVAFISLCLFLNNLYTSLHSRHRILFYASLYLHLIICMLSNALHYMHLIQYVSLYASQSIYFFPHISFYVLF